MATFYSVLYKGSYCVPSDPVAFSNIEGLSKLIIKIRREAWTIQELIRKLAQSSVVAD